MIENYELLLYQFRRGNLYKLREGTQYKQRSEALIKCQYYIKKIGEKNEY